MVEDLEEDAFLVERVLRNSGVDPVLSRVETETAYVTALENETWDIVICDYAVPGFGAPRAMEVLNEGAYDIPLVVVSGVVGEEQVISTLRAGAEHFLAKSDLARLPVIVDRTLRAVARRRESQRELRQHRDHLEELVNERTAELEITNAKLKGEVASRIRTEEKLRENESRYRTLVEGGMDGICIMQARQLTYTNRLFDSMVGYSAAELMGSSLDAYIAKTARDDFVSVCSSMEEGRECALRFETVLVHKGGRHVDVEIGAKIMNYDGTAAAIMLVIRDIAARKKADSFARQTEHSEALAVVAQGVAQSFSNIITLVDSFAASIADSFLPHTQTYDAAKNILDATHHATELTKRLYSVTRMRDHDHAETSAVSLKKVLSAASELVDRTLAARDITIRIRRPESLPYVVANETELLDTLIHLLLNAIDAMPDGGVISMRAIERRILRPRSNPDAVAGTFVGICIQDSGKGMAKEDVAKAFEPFFTTKEGDEAFGLGLPAAQGLAHGWGGWIDLRSKLGKGTRVRIFVSKAAVPGEKELVTADVLGKAVLVLDDNPGRRTMMARALEQAGMTPYPTGTAAEAIDMYRNREGGFALSIVDWILPDGMGQDVIRTILTDDPEAHVLVISGFARDYARSQMRFGAWGFLQKPFSAKEFMDEVVKALTPSGA